MRSPRTCSTNLKGPVAVGCRSASSPHALDVTLGVDEAHGREQPLGHLVAEHDPGFVEAEGDRMAVLDLYALDQPKLRSQGIGRAFLGDGGEGEPDVLRRELTAAIVELDAFAQMKPPGAATIRDLPALRQHRRQLAGLGITVQEIFKDGLEDHVLSARIEVRY